MQKISKLRVIKKKTSELKEKIMYTVRNLLVTNQKIIIPALAVAGVVISLIIFFLFANRQNNPRPPKENACYYVRSYVWNMGTEKEKEAGILYDRKNDQYWIKERDGSMTQAKDYNGTNREPIKFSFTEKQTNDTVFGSCDIGVSDIYHGTLEKAERGYAYLKGNGYANLLDIWDAGSVDIYLKKGNAYYRYLIILQAGGDDCIVAYSKIPEETWNRVNTREVE